MRSPRRTKAAALQKWRDHPWSPALFTALGILLAVAFCLLTWGLYRVVSTYFFIFAGAVCLSEALWHPKMLLKRGLGFFTNSNWSPRAFMLTQTGVASAVVALALMVRCCTTQQCGLVLVTLSVMLFLDTRVNRVFHIHRLLLTDDDLVALVCLIGLLLVFVLGVAFPLLGLANESAELAQRVGRYSEQLPQVSVAGAVRSLDLHGLVRGLGKDYENQTWYVLANRTIHDIVEGEFDLASEWQGWRGNRTLWDLAKHYAEMAYAEAKGSEAMTTPELATTGAKVFTAAFTTTLRSLRSILRAGLGLMASLTDTAIRACYFVSLLLYFLGRKNSVLHVLLGTLGDDSQLSTEIQDILTGVFKFPAARMVTRFWSTCLLAYLFHVRYLWLLSLTTTTMSFAPIALGNYPYLVAIPWWLGGSVRTGSWFARLGGWGRSCIWAVLPAWIVETWITAWLEAWGIGEFREEFWLGAVFMVAMFVVHSWLDNVELRCFSVSKHVPPYAIGLTVLLGFEHFGIWALFYCPLLLCAATLAYRICIKGEFLADVAAATAAEGSDDSAEEAESISGLFEDPAKQLMDVVKRLSNAAFKVHNRGVPDSPLRSRLTAG